MLNRLVAVSALLLVFAADANPRVPLVGKVIDESTKKPVPDFHLSLRRSSSPVEPGEELLNRKVHNIRGTFTVNVAPGPLLLTVESPGYLPAGLTVSGGGKAVTVPLQRGATLTGRVLGPDGKGVPQVDVGVDFFSPALQRRDLHATTDANGAFSVFAQPGDRTVRFKAEGFVDEERRVNTKRPKTAVPDVQLARPVSLAGSVVDDLGEPLAQVRVRTTLQNPTMHDVRDGMTNAEGKFTIGSLRPGKYQVEATLAVHVPRKLENVDIPTASPLQIHLDRGALVRGFIRGSTDQERPYVMVYLGPTVTTLINLKEEFGINAVPSGKVPVYAEVQESGSVRRTPLTTIETKNGGSANVDISLPDAPVLTGTVTEASNPPTRPVVVQFLQPNPPAFPPPLSVMTNSDGSFKVVGLMPGTYEISVSGREVVSSKTLTMGITNTSATIDVKPQPRPTMPTGLPSDVKQHR
jgi:hypothetical protein